jgi:protein gp37
MESASYTWRLEHLRQVPAAVRFVSAEPLLGPLDGLRLDGVDWLIAGGESQPNARPTRLEWFRELRDACLAAGIPFFLKQLGGHPRKRGGDDAVLDGRRWTELPVRPSSSRSVLVEDRVDDLRAGGVR